MSDLRQLRRDFMFRVLKITIWAAVLNSVFWFLMPLGKISDTFMPRLFCISVALTLGFTLVFLPSSYVDEPLWSLFYSVIVAVPVIVSIRFPRVRWLRRTAIGLVTAWFVMGAVIALFGLP